MHVSWHRYRGSNLQVTELLIAMLPNCRLQTSRACASVLFCIETSGLTLHCFFFFDENADRAALHCFRRSVPDVQDWKRKENQRTKNPTLDIYYVQSPDFCFLFSFCTLCFFYKMRNLQILTNFKNDFFLNLNLFKNEHFSNMNIFLVWTIFKMNYFYIWTIFS